MRILVVFLGMVLAIALNAAHAGQRLTYELEVEGMVCAFCAYNAGRHLGDLTGVAPGSVAVDLQEGRVCLTSNRSLERQAVAEALENAGFSLTVMRQSQGNDRRTVPEPGQSVMGLEVDADALGAGKADALLQTLGRMLVERGGSLRISAPARLEKPTLKPLLMGRKAIPPSSRSIGAGRRRKAG